jgi:ABC-type branched-subunit amino acid transport system permease subunit
MAQTFQIPSPSALPTIFEVGGALFSFACLIVFAVLFVAMLRLCLFLARTRIVDCYFALVTLAAGDVIRLLLIAERD